MKSSNKSKAVFTQSRLEKLKKLEESLGVVFSNKHLLNQAFIHPSFTGENGLPHSESNQRLEYLGDSVIYVVTATLLYDAYPYESEGVLTQKRINLIKEETLSKAARHYNLDKYLLLSHGGSLTKIQTLSSTLGDTFEALLGAMYLDAGLDAVTAFVLRTIKALGIDL